MIARSAAPRHDEIAVAGSRRRQIGQPPQTKVAGRSTKGARARRVTSVSPGTHLVASSRVVSPNFVEISGAASSDFLRQPDGLDARRWHRNPVLDRTARGQRQTSVDWHPSDRIDRL